MRPDDAEGRVDDVAALEAGDPDGMLRAVASSGAQVREAVTLAAEAGVDRLAAARATALRGGGGHGWLGDLGRRPGRGGRREPVVAGALAGSLDAGTGVAEFAWTGATPALRGSAVVPDNRVGPAVDGVLVLTAPGRPAAVTVQSLPARGGPPTAPVPVRVPAGHTVAIVLSRLGIPPGNSALVVTPAAGSGPVYGARMLLERGARGLLFSILPLEATEATVRVPTAVGDPAAGAPAP